MVIESEQQNVLPKDLMGMQLDQIDLLLAMYAPDDAITIDSASNDNIDALKGWCEKDDAQLPHRIQSSIDMVLALDIPDLTPILQSDNASLHLSMSVPLIYDGHIPTDPPLIKLRLQQPSWMSRAQVASVNTTLPEEDVLTVIEHVKEAVLTLASERNQAPAKVSGLFNADSPVIRVWFYFPSISTRSKRDDLVTNAPRYGLTGFLLAGKPGILCLEGGSAAIDDFMKFIKTDSWGNIPSQHKKVSERHRETATRLQRTFDDMQEITEMVGERRGERANRSDLRGLACRAWSWWCTG